jgi:hypothetical protein
MNSLDVLLQKIVSLLNGDRSAAKRLVGGVMQRYPGHRAQWYLEKVITDLERDRY